jgi:hypothetical protein
VTRLTTRHFGHPKLRCLVRGYKATVPLSEGIKETIEGFDAGQAARRSDKAANKPWYRLAEADEGALRRVAISSEAGTKPAA